MFASIVERLRVNVGAPGIIACLALVLAMGGSVALAAKSGGGLSAKQKKEVEKIAKKFAGKAGPAGAQGSPGAAGSAGPAGKDGASGTNGTNGANGKSVKVEPIPTGELECEERGGALLKQEGAVSGVEVCTGAPWPGGGTLPSKATLTGTWATVVSGGVAFEGISFPLPLAAELDSTHVKTIAEGGSIPAECENAEDPGTASPAEPEADPGFLCVYVIAAENTATITPTKTSAPGVTEGAGISGSIMLIASSGGPVMGSWAVTAE